MSDPSYVRGLTIRSVIACAVGVLSCAVMVHWSNSILAAGGFSPEHSVPFEPILVLVLLLLLGAAARRLRVTLLTRAELLCVLYTMLIATPFLTQGFWHRFVSITSTVPRTASLFTEIDSYPRKLWPHGSNRVQNLFDAKPGSPTLETSGNVTYEKRRVRGEDRIVALLSNRDAGGASRVAVTLPLHSQGQTLRPGEPMMIALLALPGESPDFSLPTGSRLVCRISTDAGQSVEAFGTTAQGKRTFSQPEGFLRVGTNSLPLPQTVRERLTLEWALEGPGKIAIADPWFFSVHALESIYRGRLIVTQSEFDRLPASHTGTAIVRPDDLWSWAGLKFFFTGYIPWSQWFEPIRYWLCFMTLIAASALAVNVIFRKQWMESERFRLPLAQIPLAMLPESEERFLSTVWRNPMTWAGLAVALAWTLLRGANFYNPRVPDLNIAIPLEPYFSDPGWGATWQGVSFMLSGIFLSLAMFMELGVLMSLVVGFFVFRALYWLGQSTGWSTARGYPFVNEQQASSYLMYALLILLFARKYLLRVLRSIAAWDRSQWRDEALPYPAAAALLLLCVGLAVWWSRAVGISTPAVLCMFLGLVVVALVTSRLRSECGSPFSYLGLNNSAILLVLLGGAGAFGPEGLLFAMILSFMVGPTPFFLVPGAQMEVLEIGRRERVVPWHLAAVCVLGVVLGITLGGWSFLTHAYGLSASGHGMNWHFDTKPWYLFDFQIELSNETAKMLGTAADRGENAPTIEPRSWGYIGGAGATAAVALFRQAFAGFWFHPVGVLLASSFLVSISWGSCLAAWIIRLLVLRFGGAQTVRNRLQPFFVGFFCGCVAGWLLLTVYGLWLRSQGSEQIFGWGRAWAP